MVHWIFRQLQAKKKTIPFSPSSKRNVNEENLASLKDKQCYKSLNHLNNDDVILEIQQQQFGPITMPTLSSWFILDYLDRMYLSYPEGSFPSVGASRSWLHGRSVWNRMETKRNENRRFKKTNVKPHFLVSLSFFFLTIICLSFFLFTLLCSPFFLSILLCLSLFLSLRIFVYASLSFFLSTLLCLSLFLSFRSFVYASLPVFLFHTSLCFPFLFLHKK